MPTARFARYAWFVVAFTIGVIVWGAVVRATGSGAGCGSHWPTCNGEILPELAQMETTIEFVHRITSAASGLLTLALLVWAFRLPKNRPVRWLAALSFIFILVEGFLGMLLVRLELVADNASVARAVVVGVHLINTYILLAFMGLTAWAAGRHGLRWQREGLALPLLVIGLIAMLALSAAGAVTALGDTLFPMEEVRRGTFDNLDPTAQFLIDLRIIHPVFAILTSAYLFVAGRIIQTRASKSAVRRFVLYMLALVGAQLAVGALNIALAAPVWMQMAHLLLADALWIVMVVLTAEAMTASAPLPADEREQKLIRQAAA